MMAGGQKLAGDIPKKIKQRIEEENLHHTATL